MSGISLASSFSSLRQWVKHSPHPLARFLFSGIKGIRVLDFPSPKFIYSPLFFLRQVVVGSVDSFLRLVLWTPMFKSRLASCGKNLYLYGGLPYTSGPLSLHIGSSCRISAKTTITGRASASETPSLTLGNNIDIGWMTTIAVGRKVVFGDNVRVAGQCFFAGYPGHPLDAVARAKGLAETDTQVGDIVLENDVWLATGVFVMSGVTIGRGSVVAAGSVVTKDIPEFVLAGGNPARVIRSIDNRKVSDGVEGKEYTDQEEQKREHYHDAA